MAIFQKDYHFWNFCLGHCSSSIAHSCGRIPFGHITAFVGNYRRSSAFYYASKNEGLNQKSSFRYSFLSSLLGSTIGHDVVIL